MCTDSIGCIFDAIYIGNDGVHLSPTPESHLCVLLFGSIPFIMQGIQSSRIRKRAAAKRKKRLSNDATQQSNVSQPPAYLQRLLSGLEDDQADKDSASAQPNSNDNAGSPASSSSPEPCSTPTNGSASSGTDDGNDVAMEKKPAATDTTTNAVPPDVNVIVLLEGANLELTKARNGGLTLLNSDEHAHILRKSGRNANDARPDITHQCLLSLLDSPLNKAGRLKVYIRTAKNVLISVHPSTRVPRTARRFYGLMAELLSKLKVRGTSGSEPLFRVIKNPITSHLPVGTRRIVCTYNSDNITDIRQQSVDTARLAESQAIENAPGTALYVVGAIAHGKIQEDWSEENICISEYPLSAATVCGRLTFAYECLLNIL